MNAPITSIALLFLAVPSFAQDAPALGPVPEDREYSPYPTDDFPNQVFFGDTHLHTSYSWDAGMIGNALGPDQAYRFAKGETVTASTGVPARLKRPLDFLVVADHAEALGVSPMLNRADPVLLADPFGAELHAIFEPQTPEAIGNAYNFFVAEKGKGKNPLVTDQEIPKKPWEEIIDAAEAANQPGLFTAFIGYEWSSAVRGNNLHRVVVYRDGPDVAKTRIPLSADLNGDPEALWTWMEELQADTGGQVLAISHNGNLSNGQMFPDVRFESTTPIDAQYAERRQRLEPLIEVTQMKGDGEAHPALSPDDAFADFETWDGSSLSGAEPKTPDMLPREYARPALKRGLAYEAEFGVNPFKFGMIGSTDAHTSLATTGEDNFFGKVTVLEPTADPIRFEEVVAGRLGPEGGWIKAWQTGASGLSAVWARENTREAIFDAMMRREVYATTGTRLRVRVFAGYDFEQVDLPRSDFAKHGYENGVPMGGDLAASDGNAPRFLVRALRDPDGANLDRVQIVKGWLNADGSTSEKIYDIACGGRDILESACDGDVGNTVNADEATYTNDIGQAILAGFWEDPDFDAAKNAFYYVRVLEIPTPRWTTYDAKIFGIERPALAPIDVQERAYTSPIWYTPR
ncbi:DUF3604 domain-containing protein [Ruegeria arenilitoris]|uniref:DUF3604 domain-containing protein n=1 Tax=Ruegeria arenilitoris TaxID=1173585 RepID=UPI00147B734F|nr:DUF3604 domain-containing protein [Ruegeria arenilitoris]